jgi:type II secretory pathway component GspD/PulD (secretin)
METDNRQSNLLFRIAAASHGIGLCLLLLTIAPAAWTGEVRLAIAPKLEEAARATPRKISLVLRDVSLSEAMAMLAKSERVNILLAKDVAGAVNVNLHDVDLDEAIRTIAGAAGFAVEHRDGAYIVVKREEVGKYARSGLTRLRTFKVQYAKTEVVEGIVKNHLSAYGKVTKLAERKLLVVEDMPEFLDRIAALMQELDRQPRQILIEAKILEITLSDDESFGMDWKTMFKLGDSHFSFGVQGLSKPASGLDIHLINPVNADLVLKALRERNLVRTLSTPKLLALEDQQAETIIGDRAGYKVTTTINQVTTESIQFLESGVILRVTPSVDNENRILLAIHPEVSLGTISASGIPSQKTTEVTTNMLVEDGQTVFIAGLIKQDVKLGRDGVPLLGDLPAIGRLFSNATTNVSRTETIVLITPRIVADARTLYDEELRARAASAERSLQDAAARSEEGIRLLMDRGH